LGFDYGPEQDNPVPVFGPENRVTGTVRLITTITFDESFEAFSEEGVVEIFLVVEGADPLDPNAAPTVGPLPHSATGRRIPASFSAIANGDGDFGKKIAGSYLAEFSEPTGSGEAMTGQAVVTFGADGTYLGAETIAFGADHPPRFKSGKHGTWMQTGPRELTLTQLGFDYGPEQDNPVPVFGLENRVTGTVRLITTITFDENFETFSEEGVVEIFLVVDGADPLDPNAAATVGPFDHSATGRRIPAPF
jgi:hypothetical protein